MSNPYRAYQERSGTEWTRIDMLLALYDGAVERLEAAALAMHSGQDAVAVPLLARAQLLVCDLAAGVDPNAAGSDNFLRLFEFVVHAIRCRSGEKVEAALNVLRTLREGFRTIRPEAVALENSGVIPPLTASGRI